MKVTILGAGAYALALALKFNKNTSNITIWSKVDSEIKELMLHKTNKKSLPSIIMPINFTYTNDLENAVKNSKIIVIAVATKYIRGVCDELKKYISKTQHIVIASKGIEPKTKLFASKIVKQILNTNKICTISGPSFAKDMALDYPIGLSLAANNLATKKIVAKMLTSNTLKISTTNDFIGIELCGTMKNIIAIASGILDGLKLSESTKALFLTESLNDIRKLIIKFGGKEKTILSFAGFGDIILTCTSISSRNYTYGKLIGEKNKKTQLSYINKNTIEGVDALKSVYELLYDKKIKYPYIDIIYKITFGKSEPEEIIRFLINKK